MKAKLKSLLSKFIKREYENVILEIRRHIDQIILDKDIQTLLKLSISNDDKLLQSFILSNHLAGTIFLFILCM